MIFAIEHHANGRRLRIANQRVHHGAVACIALALLKGRVKRTICLAAILHDLPDWRAWFAPGPQL